MSSQWLRGGKGSDLNEHKLWVNKGHVRGCHQACAHREMCSRKSRDFHGAPSSILFVLLKFFSALKFIVDTVQNDVVPKFLPFTEKQCQRECVISGGKEL